MKSNKIILVSMVLLAMIFMGAASAVEDYNTTATDVAVDTADYGDNLQVFDEIDADGDIDSQDISSIEISDVENTAIGTDVKNDEKLGASNEDVLGEEIIDHDSIYQFGGYYVPTGEYKFVGEFDRVFPYLIFDPGCIVDASEATFIDMGIVLQGEVEINGINIIANDYIPDEDGVGSDGALVYITGSGNIIRNANFTYQPPDEGYDTYGVLIKEAYDFQLIDSDISFTGRSIYDNYEYAMKIVDCEGTNLIQGNTIKAFLPILDVDYSKGEPGLDTDLVLNTGIKNSNGIDIIGNTFIMSVIDRNGQYATLDGVMVENCNGINFINNTIEETDFITPEGEANYLNALDVYYTSDLLIQGNKISVETTGGSENAGTSYPIQLTGPYTNVNIDGNELHANCGGPALGIFSQNYYGDTEILVQNNKIDVTGLPTYNSWGLVSGIELQDNYARVYNNQIKTQAYNGYYEEGMNLYGISYAQSLRDGHQYDIQGNTIETEGTYAIYLLQADNTVIVANSLSSSKYQGDDAIYIEDVQGNIDVRDNSGRKNFYVSPDGDNGGEGSEADPLQSINYAYEIIPEGGTIYLLEGTHVLENRITNEKGVSFVGKSKNTKIDMDHQFRIEIPGLNFEKFALENIEFINMIEGEYSILVEGSFDKVNINDCIFNVERAADIQIVIGGQGTLNFNRNVFKITVDSDKLPLLAIEYEINAEIHNNIFNSIDAIQAVGSGMIDASSNYWGTNEFREINIDGLEVKDIVIAEGEINPSEVYASSEATVTVNFNNLLDINTGDITKKTNLIPDAIVVEFRAEGTLADSYVPIENGVATTTYVNDVAGSEEITVVVPNQKFGIPVTVLGLDMFVDDIPDLVLGYGDCTVNVRVPGQTGTVTIKVNGRTVATPSLVNDVVSYVVDDEYLVVGQNTVEVTYGATTIEKTFEVTTFDLDGIVTNETFFNYFNASNSYRLYDYIPEGATLDFQGPFISNDDVSFVMEINKPINMISSTKDAYIDLNTIAQGMSGENPGNRFTVSFNGSGSNISDISFHNSQLWFFNAHNLNINNLTSIVEDRQIGSGVGVVAFRGGSSHINVKNSYFSTKNNGGSSTFVLTNASYISIDNSSIIGIGNVGNLIYMNFFNMELPDGVYMSDIVRMVNNGELEINDHNNFTNCYIQGPDKVTGICILVQNMGSGNNVFENNTFVYGGSALNAGTNAIVKNNTLIGGCSITAGKNSVVNYNKVDAGISIAENTECIGNTINGTLSASSKCMITDNYINSTGNYAVTLSSTGNTVRNNYLYSKDKKGNAAISYSGSNTIGINRPLYDIQLTVSEDNLWLGNDNSVEVYINGGNGKVTIKVNDKTIAQPSLTSNRVTQTISAADIKAGINTVEVTYDGESETATFNVYGLVTNETWDTYFDEENSGILRDFVPEGATLDFQGKFISSSDKSYKMIINKPVNLITSTDDAYIDLNTTAGSLMGDDPGDSFTINNAGSGTNVTGLYFHNSQVWLTNTHNVTLDGISVVVEDQRVGSGVGATAIRNNSTYVTVKNSYFYTRNNGGSTSVALSWADYCTIENNTVEVSGNVGNMIYLNTYNVDIPEGVVYNHDNVIKNNIIKGPETATAIAWGIVINGQDNLVENNTVYYKNGVGIAAAYGGASSNNTYIGNKLYNSSSIGGMGTFNDCTFTDNYISGKVAAGSGSVLNGNEVLGDVTVTSGEAYDNTIGGTLTANNAYVHDNTAKATVLNGADARISGSVSDLDVKSNVNISDVIVTGTLRFMGSNSVVSNATVNNVVFGPNTSNKASNSKLVDSTIDGTVTFTARYSSNNALIGNNITKTVIMQGSGDVVYQNSIITTTDYAVDATNTRASQCNVSDNYLISNGKKGDAAVTFATGKDHIVENNGPDFVIDDVADVLIGSDNAVTISIMPTFKNTDVTIKVNDRVINETEGIATVEQVISASDIVLGENIIEITADGITKTITFNAFEIIIDVDNKVILGQDVPVTVTIGGASGDISIKVNGVEIAAPTLVEGSATETILSDYIIDGENIIKVTYNGFTNSTTFVTAQGNIVTQDNFFDFFDTDGFLLETVEYDELIFQGEFSDLVDYVIIQTPITITGDNATLYNIGFIIEAAEDVTIDNLTLIADTSLGSLIGVYDSINVNLTNLNITYDGGDEMAIAIDVAGDNIHILNNTIFFESHVPDDSVEAIALQLVGCTDALVDGNNITTKLPCVYVYAYDEDYYMMGSDKVNPVRLKYCDGLKFTNNSINSTTNNCSADFPTIQSIQIIGCSNSILDHNNISMIDEMTPAGMDNYMYGINFGYNKNVTFSNNNFNMSTSGGKDAAGTAYAFQGVESEVIIKGNNITSISNGPNLGIYVASMDGGDSNLIIENNFINITGYASSTGSWALVSGIEIQNGNAKIYNNTIYTQNVNEYDDAAYMYGISYAQWMYGSRGFDIQDNTVYTEGKYTISVIDAEYINVSGNVLYAHELAGDDSVNPGKCADVSIGNNIPTIPKLNVDVVNATVLTNASITVTANVEGTVSIKIGEVYEIEDAIIGTEYTLPILPAGTYDIIVRFTGNDTCEDGINDTEKLQISKITPEITVNADSISYGETLVVEIELPSDVANGATVTVNNETKEVILTEGKGSAEFNDLSAGNYTIIVSYIGDDIYSDTINNSTEITVNMADVTVDVVSNAVVYGDNVIVNITGSVDGDYTVTVNGVTKDVVLVAGEVASVDFGVLDADSYVIVAEYAETGNYNAAVNDTVVVTVGKADVTVDVVAEDVTYGDAVVVNVTGSVDGDYTVTVNGVTKDVVLVAGEVVSVDFGVLDANVDGYAIIANYTETANYAGIANDTEIVIVNKAETPIIVFADSIVYGDVLVVEIELPADVANGATVTVNDITKDVVLVDGKGSVEFAGVDAGNHTVVVSYAGDDNYLEATNDTVGITVSKADVTIDVDAAESIAYGETLIVNIELPDDVISNATVTIDDETKDVVLSEGKGSVEFTGLTGGVHDIIVKYAGDNNYNNATVSTTVKVTRITPTIKVTADNIVYGEDLVVNVELSGDVSRRAIVTIGNESKFVSLVDGVGSVKFSGLDAGTYTVTATYNGDVNYDAKAAANTTVKVTRATPTIDVFAKNIKAGEELVVNVKVSDSITRRVIVTIGNEYKLVSLTNGSGIAKFSGLDAGTYTVTATYNGDENYNAKASANTTVTVNKGAAAIQATIDEVVYGEDVVVDIQLPSDISRRVNVTLGNESKLVSVVNGSASVKFSGLSVGAYTATVLYSGDAKYLKSSVDVTAKVVKATPEIQVTANDISVGEALSVDIVLPADVARRATVTVGNVTKNVSLKEGVGSVKFTGLEAGTHEVIVSYNGDTNYKTSSTSTTIEVKE